MAIISRMTHLITGIDYTGRVVSLQEIMKTVEEQSFDFVVVPVVHPNFERIIDSEVDYLTASLPTTRPDTELSPYDWQDLVVGKTTTHIYPDSKCERLRLNAEKVYHKHT